MKLSRPLILGSQSPRRKELLLDAGYQFEIIPSAPEAETPQESNESPVEFVARLAKQKAEDIQSKISSEVFLLTCDTVAEFENEIFGKPKDRADAKRILESLRGKTHHVHSGVYLIALPEQQVISRVETSTLMMKDLSDQEIEDYLNTELWIGKAGAFGIQDRIEWITLISGTESNVVGLPIERLPAMFTKLDSQLSA